MGRWSAGWRGDGGESMEGGSGAIVFGERIHHREAPQALADGKADVAMVYYHLALRYVLVFPGVFEIVCEGWDPEGDRTREPANGMVVTEYAVASARWAGTWGEAFVGFIQSREVVAIYEGHGIRSVTG